MKLLKRLFAVWGMALLASCGGGSGDGAPYGGPSASSPGTGTGTTPVTASDISLTASANTVANDGTSTVTITAVALNGSRAALPNATMTLSADNGGVLTIADNATVTDSSGKITATLGIGANRANRIITVTARSGSVTATTVVQVVTTPGAARPTTVEVIASSTTVGTGGDQVTIQAFVKDASNNALPNVAVTFSADTGTLSGASAATNAAGVASSNFAAGSDRSNRRATITVAAGTISSQITLPITGTKLVASGPTSLILGAGSSYTVQVVDSKGVVLANTAVTAASTLRNGLAPATATTDANGQVQFTYTATNAGTDALTFAAAGFTTLPLTVTISGDDFAFVSPAASSTVNVGASQVIQVRLRQGGVAAVGKVITFATTGGSFTSSGSPVTTTTATTNASGIAQVTLTGSSAGPVTVQATVQGGTATATLPLSVVAVTPAKLVLQITPTAIAPNPAGSTTSQARVIARVTDAAGNPVQNVTVNFSRVTDPSGGNVLQPSAVTDANGQASVPYSAGAESTANNGVVLQGTVAAFPGVAPGVAYLTVNQSALFISLGTGNTIGNIDPQTYRKDYTAYVTDANGVAVSGVTLTLKVLPLHYLRGRLVLIDDVWQYDLSVLTGGIRVCRNEDANYNGILDAGEDDNASGTLQPGNVVAVSPGVVQTDANGRATISLAYAESFAPWVNVRLTASATVAGTESRRDTDFILSGSAPDFSTANGPPAGVNSPFGSYQTVSSSAAICKDYPAFP